MFYVMDNLFAGPSNEYDSPFLLGKSNIIFKKKYFFFVKALIENESDEVSCREELDDTLNNEMELIGLADRIEKIEFLMKHTADKSISLLDKLKLLEDMTVVAKEYENKMVAEFYSGADKQKARIGFVCANILYI
uniref:Uncharacterized protein n=1 Tax=Heterorhabditis bacteriophora TaxID=37862 RepID=A0A1I7X2Z6_HETBA